MKFVLALFLMSMFLQPGGLQACDMDEEKSTGHHAEMNHAVDPDCCDSSPSEPMDDCEPVMQCNLLSSLVPAIQAGPGTFETPTGHHFDLLNADAYAGPPARPLFRPPIA